MCSTVVVSLIITVVIVCQLVIAIVTLIVSLVDISFYCTCDFNVVMLTAFLDRSRNMY